MVQTRRLKILGAGLAVTLVLSALAVEHYYRDGANVLELADPIATVRALFPDVPHIDTEAVRLLTKASEDADFQLVDVRDPEEFAVSHIPGAINVPLESKDEDLLTIVRSDIPVIVYCSIGYRSAIVARRLQASGRKNVQNYVGSFFAWANSGNPLRSAHGPEQTVHPYDRYWGRYLRRERRADF
jgi:rhodanese-related sulfurtransferase